MSNDLLKILFKNLDLSSDDELIGLIKIVKRDKELLELFKLNKDLWLQSFLLLSNNISKGNRK